MTPDIQISSAGGIQTLRLARPAKKNALTEVMYGALADGLEMGDADDATAEMSCTNASSARPMSACVLS